MAERGLPSESVWMMVMYIVLNFAIGLAIVWLYAAIRPRFGPGPRTAVMAGFFVWFVAWFLGFGSASMSFLIPAALVVPSLIWGVIELCVAALAGGWAYREESGQEIVVEPAAPTTED
jgi:hypothetical protein